MLYKVYDPSFLIETKRPLAKWELAETIHLTPSRTDAVGSNVHPVVGREETVAETRNEKGEVIGRWVVKWGENGAGVCHEVGYMVKCAAAPTSRIQSVYSLNYCQVFQCSRRAFEVAFSPKLFPTKLSYQHIMYGSCCYMIYHWIPTRHNGTFSANVWTISDLDFVIFYAYDKHFPSPEWKTSVYPINYSISILMSNRISPLA